MALSIPFTSGANNSDIISHGMGPKPTENAKINKQRLAKGRKSIVNAKAGWVFWIQKYRPRQYNVMIITSADVIRRIRLPSRSIKTAANPVANTITRPTMMFSTKELSDVWADSKMLTLKKTTALTPDNC